MEFFKQCPSKRPEDMKQMKTTSSASYNCLGEWPVLTLGPVMTLETESLEETSQLGTFNLRSL